ncbi:MAG TPA: hypothetical protein VE909_05065 [Xanthobacteraceae bacterium]|nr:hypothetical protein [Xanthobacteraceae bacterium]
MRRITHVLWIIVALIFLLEAWLWAKLAPIVAFLVWLVPLQPIKARIAAAIEGLPPAATLVVFAVPVAVLFPIKLAALWAFGHGHWIAGVGALVFAKLAGLGVTAFVFEATRPKLMQIGWFAQLYELVMRGLAWAHTTVDPIKRRLRKYVHVLQPRNAGRFYRHLMRVRRRMQQPAPAE